MSGSSGEPAAKKAKKAAAATTSTTPERKPKKEPAAVVVTPPRSAEAIVVEKKKSGTHPVDVEIHIKGQDPSDYTVYQEVGGDGKWYDAVLNQCNIGNNNNKYYRLQILQGKVDRTKYYAWFKWGRVGEAGRNGSSTWLGPTTLAEAKKAFGKKYQDKTGNAFGAKTFVAKTGKYDPIEIDNDVEVNEDFMEQQGKNNKDDTTGSNNNNDETAYMKSALDPTTKELIEVLFSREMQDQVLKDFSIDLKKLPLGVPSRDQIQRGVDILNEIEERMDGKNTKDLADLSSRFYTAIPHAFGRRVPPTIATKPALQDRYDMCNILLDLYQTNDTVRRIAKESNENKAKALLPNPIDEHYKSLDAELTLLDTTSTMYQTIQDYFDQTKCPGSRCKLLNAWSVNRKDEADRFARFQHVGNRRLLWHGTNIAVVAPILTSGLRIMPHSGGRVGAGIYLANLQQKSAQYTRGYGSKFACMFLCEAPLGLPHVVIQDGPHASNLKKAPTGFDSVQAVGNVAPPASIQIQIDGHDIMLAPSPPSATGAGSTFEHDEFLVYEEAQVRIRFVLTVKLS
jgi:poly [ADP-ribose] polymerase 2/3/4